MDVHFQTAFICIPEFYCFLEKILKFVLYIQIKPYLCIAFQKKRLPK